jgi:hypothetical protein
MVEISLASHINRIAVQRNKVIGKTVHNSYSIVGGVVVNDLNY